VPAQSILKCYVIQKVSNSCRLLLSFAVFQVFLVWQSCRPDKKSQKASKSLQGFCYFADAWGMPIRVVLELRVGPTANPGSPATIRECTLSGRKAVGNLCNIDETMARAGYRVPTTWLRMSLLPHTPMLLESEQELVGGMLVERFWDQGRDSGRV
jgi:hypothetical protein